MALFRCLQDGVHRTFVIELTDAKLVKQARAIAQGNETVRVHVIGKIVKEPRTYNKPWSWHLDPGSIEFFENSTEVCDSSVLFVEEHLAEVGGDFLPHGVWCPWKSRVIEEVFPDRDGLSTLL